MRRLFILTTTLVILASCGEKAPTEPPIPDPEIMTVSMPGFSFSPFTTIVPIGGTVFFDFPAEPHNVIFSDVPGAPADISATSSRTVSRVFPARGTFPYDCRLHPGMEGVVIVQ